MSHPLLDEIRADMQKRSQRIRLHQRIGYALIALHVALVSWSASRVALGDAGSLWLVFLNGGFAVMGLRWNLQRWADWQALCAKFEREIERLENQWRSEPRSGL